MIDPVEKISRNILRGLVELSQRLNYTPDEFYARPGIADSLYEMIDDGVILANESGDIVAVNKSAGRLLGYMCGELLGMRVTDIIPARYRDRHAARQEEYYQNPTPRSLRDLSALRADGEEFPILIALEPIVSESGTLVLAVLREYTEE